LCAAVVDIWLPETTGRNLVAAGSAERAPLDAGSGFATAAVKDTCVMLSAKPAAEAPGMGGRRMRAQNVVL
jgi:hypothetical protein